MNEFNKALWIGPAAEERRHPVLYRDFDLCNMPKSAALHITGVGLFEAFINNTRVGGEVLTPFFNDYRDAIQVLSFDVKNLLRAGINRIEIYLGNGWYKGRFGMRAKENNYGKSFAAIAALETDGSSALITDLSWRCRLGPVLDSGIYDGELQDYALDEPETGIADIGLDKSLLKPRFSPRLTVNERLPVREVIMTPRGETVLDFGQNLAGWVEFEACLPSGARVSLDYGEILQNGCFYNENYRSAKARFIYVSDGSHRRVCPKFTFFGFRYVRLTGFSEDIRPEDFSAAVVHSSLERTGNFSCGHEKLTRLYENCLWSQKSNFVDMPTDCPQRDERLGWTGDAQVFCETAMLNMDCRAFYEKYLRDLRFEQLRLSGGIPCYIPNLDNEAGTSAVWGDAATIIPMRLYEAYGDKSILSCHYPLMRDWVDYLEQESGGKYLFSGGTHFGDWLALDGKTPTSFKGGTDDTFISSVYWYNSARLVSQAAEILDLSEDAKKYAALAQKVRNSVLDEYFTPNGRLAVDTQTGYIISLHFGIYRDKKAVCEGFLKRLERDCYEIKCGFVGAPLLCNTLAENGFERLAYHFLLNESYPGWLHCVKLGATTIWERWNSLLPDGTCSGTEMNSFNHYAFGSIAGFMYTHIAGLRRETSGWRRVTFEPKPNAELGSARASYESVSGRWESSWEIMEDGRLSVSFLVPEGAGAKAILPGGDTLEIGSGRFEREYMPSCDYRLLYTKDTPLAGMWDDGRVIDILRVNGLVPILGAAVGRDKEAGTWTLESISSMSYLNLNAEALRNATREILDLKCRKEQKA